MAEIFQLRIDLQDSKPPIWRRILVEKNITFYDLHQILLIVMDWHGGHLYEFEINETRISDIYPDDDFMDFRDPPMDASKTKLTKMKLAAGMKFTYIYDFGDYWVHKIKVEKVLPRDPNIQYPTCTKGKLNTPPDDCGGIYGFYEMLDIIADPTHPEFQNMVDWLGEGYDPSHFDLGEINEILQDMEP